MIKPQKGQPPVQIDDGAYIARCYSMVHIGTVSYQWQGTTQKTNKVRITFEIPSELRNFKEGDVQKPVAISGEWSLSFGKKSKLRPLLEAWRGKVFTDLEIDEFDVTKLVGKAALITVVKNEKGYPEITGIVKLAKGMECPDQINKSVILDYDNFDEDIFESLPNFIKEKMKNSDEYRSMKGEKVENSDVADETNPDDIPF